ncbi:MAG: SMC-Scp complex subunit ScpB [Lachnospiraceae bacterium]|nr:SMC-Scp complex subunit ScpB [Lachnospiraceae bacterium]
MKCKAAIEAVLFATGSAVEKNILKNVIVKEGEQLSDKTFKEAVESLLEDYSSEERGIRLIELNGKLQLCTKNEYYDALIQLVNAPEKRTLTDVLLETLSIVAYKQPVTRAEVEKIRGVSCAHAINRLVDFNFITEVGRLDAPGHPILFGTTDDFLRAFGISSMDDLPDISPDKMADFQKQAEEEARIKVET